MEVTSLIKELRENKVAVKLVDDQLEVSLLGDSITPELLGKLKANKQGMVDYLSAISSSNNFQEIPKIAKSESYSVSNAQLRIWLESQDIEASIAYHMPFEIYLQDGCNLDFLEKSIQYVIKRHEILRTVFRYNEDKELRQYILPEESVEFKLGCQDFSQEDRSEEQAQKFISDYSNLPFDLSNDLLIKASVLQYSDDTSIFFCVLHHSICDAWSIPVLKQEILSAYSSFQSGKVPELPALNIQYKDYVSWNKNNLEDESLNTQKSYWLNQFKDEIPVFDFPAKNARPTIKTYNGQTLKASFGSVLTEKIKDYQQEKGGSLFMVMLSTLYVMLSRYTGNDDLVVGSPFAAREHVDLKNQIGFYTNTLALRNRIDGGDSFNSFFEKVKKSVLEAYNNQQYPFDRLVKDLKLKKDLSRNPIFDVMLVVLPSDQNTVTQIELESEDEIVVLKANKTSKFDFLFYVEETQGDLALRIEYNTDIYDEELVRQFIGDYKKMTNLLLSKPKQSMSSINYLPETGLVNSTIDLQEYNSQTVMEMFEAQVARTPDATALCYKNKKLTYLELNEEANQIANYLREQYPQIKGKNIGVLLGRSQFNVTAMFGILKAGACYVPIDIQYQEERKNFILKDAKIDVVLSTSEIAALSNVEAVKVIELDTFDFSNCKKNNPTILNELGESAFVIYTSGSTGNPKGVAQTHRMLNNLIQWNKYDANIPSGLKHLQYCSFSFDVSLQDCWFVLSSGGTLYITPESMKIDFPRLAEYIVTNKIEVLSFPFSALSNFFKYIDEDFEKGQSLRHIISSGEQLTLDKAMVDFFIESPEIKLHNHYGPSETHVVTSHTISAERGDIIRHVPIGRPLPNTTIYLLDKQQQPVPKNVTGEIYVGGANVANGYLNLPDLTAERFIENPFRKGERLYKTGDLAFLDMNGVLNYLGRGDNQVKIRGYRIELNAIKNKLLTRTEIHQVHVDVLEHNDENVIAAYVCAETEVDKQELKSHLRKSLPEYMVPAYIMQLDQMPLTSNGKVNKKQLPKINETSITKANYIPPETSTEKEIATLWEMLLSISTVGLNDNFFELGGHSLHITRMLYDINETFGINLSIKNILSSQNIQELAQVIDEEILFANGISTNQSVNIENQKKSTVWEI